MQKLNKSDKYFFKFQGLVDYLNLPSGDTMI